jgi:hypothetical protein
MRRPGGAVAPAMKPATGFVPWALIHSAASSSAAAADLADHDDPVRLRVVHEHLDDVQVRGAVDRVAADADAGALAHAAAGQLPDRLVGQRPERETTPMWPALWMYPGAMPMRQPPLRIRARSRA